jgi:cytochrome c biogenesis protein CcmG/thiol:disulfide interchange protein DsbE
MKRWAAIAALVPFSALLIVSVWLLSRPDPGPASFTSPMRPVPEGQITTLAGEPFDFGAHKGKAYLVNFWAPWCVPCRAEHPILLQMKEQGVAIVGVLNFSSGDKVDPPAAIERGKAMLTREGSPFEVVPADVTGDVSLSFGITGVPETFLVDANGMIVKTLRGPILDAQIAQRFVDAWKAEAAKSPATPAPAAP